LFARLNNNHILTIIKGPRDGVMMINATFKVEETGVPEKTNALPQVTDNVVSSTHRMSGIRTHNVSGDS